MIKSIKPKEGIKVSKYVYAKKDYYGYALIWAFEFKGHRYGEMYAQIVPDLVNKESKKIIAFLQKRAIEKARKLSN